MRRSAGVLAAAAALLLGGCRGDGPTAPRLTVATPTLPNGTVGVAYSQTVVATGGGRTKTWAVASGALPAGLTLLASGVLSGTPATAGASSFTLQVTSGKKTATKAYNVTVLPALVVSTTTVREGAVGVAYLDTLEATGGSGGFAWAVSIGTLPAGMQLAANGELNGTPTTVGAQGVTVQVTSGTQTATRALTITVRAALTVATATLPGATQGDVYAQTLSATGGTGTYDWDLSAGTLPDGMTLSATGVLGGTLTGAGTDTFTVRVASGEQVATRQFIVVVNPMLSITTASLPDGTVGIAYLDTLHAVGTSGAVAWSIASGAPPAGVTLLSSGVLSGEPTTAGVSDFDAQVTSGGRTATRALSVTVVAQLAMTTTVLPNGTVGAAYDQTLLASGGTGSYLWTVIVGTPPAGLTLTATGVLDGVPTTPSVNPFTVRVTSGAQTVERAFSVQISPADAASVEITPPGDTVELGDSTALSAVAKDAGGVVLPGRPIAWTTLNGSIASVSGVGMVRALTLGTVGIIATASGAGGVPVSDTAFVSVIPVPVDSVEVVPAAVSLILGESQQMSVVTRDRNGIVLNGRTVTWSSSDANVAAIDAGTGLMVSGVAGTATITALSEGVTGTANVTVSRGLILTAVAGGDRHSCGLTEANLVFCWGRNLEGQLGDSSVTDRLQPVRVRGSTPYASVRAGGNHSCALTAAGAAWCWGLNASGRLGDGTVVSSSIPVAVSGGIVFASIVVGGTHTCGLTVAGAAYCWGLGASGQLGNNSTQNANPSPVLVQGGVTFASLTAGGVHTCGLTSAGVAYCWGLNAFGQIGDGTVGAGTNRIVPTAVTGGLTFTRLSAGNSHTCGISTGGASYCWGLNGAVPNAGRLGDGTTVSPRTSPTLVAGGLAFTDIVAGGVQTCARTATGLVYCWGQNDAGQVGDGTTTSRQSPTALSGGFTWDALMVGNFHGCGIRDLGRTFCWGQNSEGAVGDATATPRLVPVPVRP